MYKEVLYFFQPVYKKHLSISNESDIREENNLQVNIDILFQHIPCALLTLNTWGFVDDPTKMNPSTHVHGILNENIIYSRFGPTGERIANEFMGDNPSYIRYPPMIRKILTGLQDDEQCRLTASFHVDKVLFNIYIYIRHLELLKYLHMEQKILSIS